MRLLNDKRSREAVRSFYRQFLSLDEFERLSKSPEAYPEFRPTMPNEWRDSLYAFVEHVFWEGDGRLETLLTSPKMILSDGLAKLYGLQPAPDRMYTGKAGERIGLLTQPGLMALQSNPEPDQTPVITRGLFVRERLLCEELPLPPDGATDNLPMLPPNLTPRERLAEYVKPMTCAGCHKFFNPIGFALDAYDGLGRFRLTENGRPVDASGEILAFSDGADAVGKFNNAEELVKLVAPSQQLRRCTEISFFRYGMGRSPVEADGCSLRAITEAFEASKGDLRQLLVAIATSDTFRHQLVEEVPQP
jgi:hypothetical protein